MYLIFFAFIVLIAAGLYTGELGRKAALIYISLVVVCFCTIALTRWNIHIYFTFMGFLDAILLVHVLKGDITIS